MQVSEIKKIMMRALDENSVYTDDFIEGMHFGIETAFDSRVEPSEEMCDKARGVLMGFQMRIYDFATMRTHLEMGGWFIPPYMNGKSGHITKWEQAILVWQSMVAAVEVEQ